MWATDIRHLIAGLATAAVACQVFGQPSPVITDADIEQARQKHRMPSDAQLKSAPVPERPNIDALPQPRTTAPIDLEALAKGYASQVDALNQAQGLAAGPGLLVFVSLSMPPPTLRRLIEQATRAKASVLIRGLSGGSLRQTVTQVQSLIGDRQVAVQIDPQAFDRFAITRVPSFVLIRDGTRPIFCTSGASGTCAPPEGFVRTAGDVSLDYALEHIQRAAPHFSKDAAGFLKRLKG